MAEQRRSRGLVLIVDEDQGARDLYGDWFTSEGFEVMSAVGLTGLGWALRRDRPRLVITDLVVGDLVLAQLMARLRSDRSTRCIPVVLITAVTDSRALDAAKRMGVAAALPKFGDLDALRVWVARLLD